MHLARTREQGFRFNVKTLFAHSVLTPLLGGVGACKHQVKLVFAHCSNTKLDYCLHTLQDARLYPISI